MEAETVKVIREMQSEIDLYERKIDNILMAILVPNFMSSELEEKDDEYSHIIRLLRERSKDELKTQKTPATTIDQGDKPIESDKEAIEKAVAEKPYLKEGDLVVCDGLMCQVLEFCNDNKAKIRDLIGREKE